MDKQISHFIKIINIRYSNSDDFTYRSLEKDIYKNFFTQIVKVSDTKFWATKHIILSDDLIATSKKFVGSVKQSKSNKKIILILEVLEEKKYYENFDDVFTCLINALSNKEFPNPWCICIVTPNIEALHESIMFTRKLIDLCNNRKIALISIPIEHGVKPKVISQGELPQGWNPPLLDIQVEVQEKKNELENIQLEIKKDFNLLFGHFAIKKDSKIYHISSVASVNKLARNENIVEYIYHRIVDLVQYENITIDPIGIPLGGINELAIALTQKENNRICHIDDDSKLKECSIVILCDFLNNVYDIESIIKQHKEDGHDDFLVIGIARYKDFKDIDGVKSIHFVDTQYNSYDISGKEECPFCFQGVPTIDGENIRDFEKAITNYDSYTFWEFIRQDVNFIELGHWPSNKTINHYHFRINAKPIFLYHGYDLSLRVKNLLLANKILSHWISKIVCTEGEYSGILSAKIAQAIGLKETDIIKIPREYFNNIAGKDIDPLLIEYINKNIGTENLNGKNIIIVDQAAHHFGTLVPLKTICEYYKSTILAFIVFVDRTGPEVSKGEYLFDTHYFSLYSWPSPPRTQNQCPCRTEAKQ